MEVAYNIEDVVYRVDKMCSAELQNWNFLKEDQEDIMQEARIKVIKNLYRYNPQKASLNTYFGNIIRSTVVNVYRLTRAKKREGMKSEVSLYSLVKTGNVKIGNDNEAELLLFIASKSDDFQEVENSVWIKQILQIGFLTAQEKDYVSMAIRGYHTDIISNRLGVSKARVSNIKKNVIRKMNFLREELMNN